MNASFSCFSASRTLAILPAAVGLLTGVANQSFGQAYEVKIKTSDRAGAQTDSNIHLQSVGLEAKGRGSNCD